MLEQTLILYKLCTRKEYDLLFGSLSMENTRFFILRTLLWQKNEFFSWHFKLATSSVRSFYLRQGQVECKIRPRKVTICESVRTKFLRNKIAIDEHRFLREK